MERLIHMPNQLTEIAREVLSIESDIPYRFDCSKEKPTVNDFEIYTFEQTWGSTALGFGGYGGQAMTSARTYVFVPIYCNQKCFVYFGSRFAYAVPYSNVLMEDINKQQMEPVSQCGKYVSSV